MKAIPHDFSELLRLDFDDIVERARTLDDSERPAALDHAVSAIHQRSEASDRLKVVLFVQTLLAAITDSSLEAKVAGRVGAELTQIITSTADSDEVKRSAITAVALLLIKASDLNAQSASILRDALISATTSSDPEAAAFASRVIQRQYRTHAHGGANKDIADPWTR
jgi:hypothetical protein